MTAEFLGIALVLGALAAILVAVPLWRHRQQPAGNTRGLIIVVALVLAVPLVTLALYTQVTTYPWDQGEQPQARQQQGGGAANGAMAGPILDMVKQLEDRMATAPTVEGLAMLGRSYVNLERLDDAVNAYHRAWEMTEGKDPNVSLGYAEALLLADRNTILTSAGDLLDEVLTQLPDNPKALWYGGMSAVARGNQPLAQQRLAHLLNQPDIPDQLRNVVQQQLAAMGAEVPAAPDQNVASQNKGADKGTAAQISATIDINPELQNRLQQDAVLFVFARETGQAGPPVAVKRITAPTFPLTVTLTDADGMMGNNKLSSVKNLTLVARISAAGNATASSGDLYGETQPDWPGDSARIQIDSSVP